MDPRTPVIVGAAQLNGSGGENEPVAMMAEVSGRAVPAGLTLDQIRVVKGVWPYSDPGTLVAEKIGQTPSTTGITQLGGNEAYDLLNQTALDIQMGGFDAVLICAAETMRTRRRDRRAGKRSAYLDEADGAIPDFEYGDDVEFWDDADWTAWGVEAANFYAMAASAVRHRLGSSPEDYLAQTAELWAIGSSVAADNPNASIRNAVSAIEIATVSATNRMIADPFPKLMTSNINVDQAAAVVLCTAEAARAAGTDPGSWVFPLAGTGSHDAWVARSRDSFALSPSMRITGQLALELAGVQLEQVTHLDLYSCFPSAVQTAQHELGVDPTTPFTLTGGMTFAGGPFNSYGMHAIAQAVHCLRDQPGLALLTGNCGWFTKHAFCVLGSEAPRDRFRYERPQALVDGEPVRPLMTAPPDSATIDAYTVTYTADGGQERAIMAVSDATGARSWATTTDPDTMTALVAADCVSMPVSTRGEPPVLEARL